MTPRFTFRLADGTTVTGPVQGAGGMVGYRRRLLDAQHRAREGNDSGLYEPIPGHVAVFPDYSAESNGKSVIIDLRMAVILISDEQIRGMRVDYARRADHYHAALCAVALADEFSATTMINLNKFQDHEIRSMSQSDALVRCAAIYDASRGKVRQ